MSIVSPHWKGSICHRVPFELCLLPQPGLIKLYDQNLVVVSAVRFCWCHFKYILQSLNRCLLLQPGQLNLHKPGFNCWPPPSHFRRSANVFVHMHFVIKQLQGNISYSGNGADSVLLVLLSHSRWCPPTSLNLESALGVPCSLPVNTVIVHFASAILFVALTDFV